MSDTFKIGRIPDYILKAKVKDGEYKGKVGVAWINENETFTIRLDPFVVLSAKDELMITLFPNDYNIPGPVPDDEDSRKGKDEKRKAR
jgi:hypothetical protein